MRANPAWSDAPSRQGVHKLVAAAVALGALATGPVNALATLCSPHSLDSRTNLQNALVEILGGCTKYDNTTGVCLGGSWTSSSGICSANDNADVTTGVFDVSRVKSFWNIFRNAKSFEGQISHWDVSSADSYQGMFFHAEAFNGDLSAWDTARATTLLSTFHGAYKFNGNLSSWDVSRVTNFQTTFKDAWSYNSGGISSWDVSNAESFQGMFYYAKVFNGDLSAWDTTRITTLLSTFSSAHVFNGRLSSWDVSRVTNFEKTFKDAKLFNADISGWDIQKAKYFTYMFSDADSFNIDISPWKVPQFSVDTSGATEYMFQNANGMHQNLCAKQWIEMHKDELITSGSTELNIPKNITGLCCPAGHYVSDANRCEACPRGRAQSYSYGETRNISSCEFCPAGLYTVAVGSVSRSDCNLGCGRGTVFKQLGPPPECLVCPAGYYNNELPNASIGTRTNISLCKQCAYARYIDDQGILANKHDEASDCNSCEGGKFWTNFNISCTVCPAGTFRSEDETNKTVCTACPAGTYLDDNGIRADLHASKQNCKSCPDGQISRVGSTLCFSCPAGWATSSTLNRNSICLRCEAGRKSSANGMRCDACERGHYQPTEGLTYCLPCLPGKIGNTTNMLRCHLCPRGKFSKAAGRENCTLCDVGQYSDEDGSAKCIQIPPGSYKILSYTKAKCEPGFKCAGGDSGRESCPPGRYARSNGSVTCFPCSPGKYADQIAATFCLTCPNGWIQENEGGVNCNKPVAGSIAAGGSSSIPIAEGWIAANCSNDGVCTHTKPCQAGTFENGDHVCISCPKGWSSTDGKTDCDICEKGKFSNNPGTVCAACPAGWFQDQNIYPSRQCKICPVGFGMVLHSSSNEPVNGSSHCRDLGYKKPRDCKGNSFLDTSAGELNQSLWSCLPCPPGTDCTGVDVTIETLYTRILSGWWQCPEDRMSFAKCTIPGACPGTDAITPNECLFDNTSIHIGCAEGRNTSCSAADNILCAACADGYVPFGDHGECVACKLENSYIMSSVYGIMLVIAMVAVVAMRVRGSMHERAFHNGLKRTILSHVQMTSIIMALNTEWPNTISVPMRMLTEVMTGAGAGSSFSCSLAEPRVPIDGVMLFYLTLTVNALMPVFVGLITYAYWIILAPKHHCFRCGKNMMYSSFCSGGCKRCLCGRKRQSKGSDPVPQAASDLSRIYDSDRPARDSISRMNRNKSWRQENLSRSLMSTRDAWWVTCIYFTYFFFPRNIRLGFQVFQCMTVCGQVYLSVEPQEKCWEADGRHIWWVMTVATPTLILYVFLLPTSTLVYLYRFRRKFHHEDQVKKQEKMMFRLGFLYSGYADACWWFDSVVFLRKIFIILFVTFGERSKYQLHYCMAVLVCMLFMQERLRPYHGERKGAVHLQVRANLIQKMAMALARKKLIQINKTSQNSIISHTLSNQQFSGTGIKHQTSSNTKMVPSVYHLSEKERLSIMQRQDRRECTANNFLHNVEVASVMILIYLVWIAQYFLMESSCQHGTSCMDSAGKTAEDTALFSSLLGAFGMGMNMLFVLLMCSIFVSSYTNHHISRAQKCCRKVFKRCSFFKSCVESAGPTFEIIVEDDMNPMPNTASCPSKVYTNPMLTENNKVKDETCGRGGDRNQENHDDRQHECQ